MSENLRKPENNSWLKSIRIKSYRLIGALGVLAVASSCGLGGSSNESTKNTPAITETVPGIDETPTITQTATQTEVVPTMTAKASATSLPKTATTGVLEKAYSDLYAEGLKEEDSSKYRTKLITKPTSTVANKSTATKVKETKTVVKTEPTKTKEVIVPTSTPVVEQVNFGFQPAKNEGNVWFLKDSDGNEVKKAIDAKGFTPDANLKVSDLSPLALGPIPADASDFQAYLNKDREGFGPLAGFTDGTNDYGQFGKTGPQVPAYSWMIHTGLSVEMPGIGKITGEYGRAAMLLIINRTNDVYRFEKESVEVIAGFEGWGRIWNGDANYVQETDKRLVNHYRHRLGYGVAESGFIGQCDKGAENCDAVTVVTVERIQWGNNADGTPRYQFRLVRAETVSAK